MPATVPFVDKPLRGGVWQQVEWFVIPFFSVSKRYTVPPGVRVEWRWFSAGVPPYWGGAFVGSAWIWVLPSIYVSLEFKPAVNCTVRITTV